MQKPAPDIQPAQSISPRVRRPPPPQFERKVAQLKPVKRALRMRLLGRATLGVSVASNGRTLLQLRGYGGLLRTFRQRRGRRLPRKHFVSSHFAPDTRHVVLADERRTLRVLRVPSARLVMTIRNATMPRWIDRHTLGFRRGCRAMTQTIGRRQKRVRTLGRVPAPCTEVLHTSPDFTRWIIADPSGTRRGVLQEYKRVRIVDVTSGTNDILISTTELGGVLLPQVSPDGKRVCFARPNFKLYCRHAGKTQLIWKSVRRPLRFDASGNRLLFANTAKNHRRARIVVVDFEAKTATITPRAAREWWKFLPGGNRIVGHGGNSSAVIYDLDQNWQADVGNPNSEWEGLWTIPGDANRFAIGRERRGTRDVYLVTLRRRRR